MDTKDIAVNGQVFPCPLSWTVEQAVESIRSEYVIQGGGIRNGGVPVLRDARIRDLAGPLTFVGGQPIQQLAVVTPFFQYSSCIIKGRTRRKFRANLYRLAESYSAYVRENTPTDGIIKDGKNIKISLIFKTEDNLNGFESEVMELMSVMTGYKRPLVEADESIHTNELILKGQRIDRISNSYTFHRVYKRFYEHDSSGNDPDNSAECDGYSDVVSLYSALGEEVNISDPEVCVQMIEDPRSDYWYNSSPEAAHIKDKAKCSKNEKKNVNNYIYMSRLLHCYFDGLNGRPSKFPSMKIQYVRHDEEFVPCPAIGCDSNPLGLPPRQRVIVHIIFWNANVRKYAMAFIRSGGVEINETTYEIDLFFRNAIEAKTFLQWKEAQTEKAWDARRRGISAAEFAISEGIGQDEEESDSV